MTKGTEAHPAPASLLPLSISTTALDSLLQPTWMGKPIHELDAGSEAARRGCITCIHIPTHPSPLVQNVLHYIRYSCSWAWP